MPRMPSRVLILAIPSFVVLILLIVHSVRSMERRRALAFWLSVFAYGVIRALGVKWVTSSIGASFPYEIHQPLAAIAGVPLQEIAGWAIVSYLGWWLGSSLSSRLGAAERGKGGPLFLQIAWCSLFLGAISWAVETAAIAAGWWHWTVSASHAILGRVPWIGLVDWFFVGADFVLPFAVITAPALRGRRQRFLSLLIFPLHFGAHLFVRPLAEWFPVPLFHLAHWVVLGLLLFLAMRSDIHDQPFREAGRSRYLPLVALAIILADIAAVALFVIGDASLLASIGPASVIALFSILPAAGWIAGGVAAVGSIASASWLLALVPLFVATLLAFGRRSKRWFPGVAVAILAVAALWLHLSSARAEKTLTDTLDRALRARDRGDLRSAEIDLLTLIRRQPSSYTPHALLAEIYYRTGRIDEAVPLFERAVSLKADHVDGHRTLAVIAMQRGANSDAARHIENGLRVRPSDLELLHLRNVLQSRTDEPVLARAEAIGPSALEGLAALSFEVNDVDGSIRILSRGARRWPAHRPFHQLRARITWSRGDAAATRAVAREWLAAIPADPEAAKLAAALDHSP